MILALLLLSPPAAADERGSYTTSEWYETIYNTDGNPVWFQIHYPAVAADYGADADPSAGPFPVIAFMHGYLGQAWMYNAACDAFASMGFIVVNIDTETTPAINTDHLGEDARTALRWVEQSSTDPEHWLYGMADSGSWTAMGHSMGGIALAHLASIEPRVTTLVGFNPYESEGDEYDFYQDFSGSALMLGGTADETATPAMVEGWFDALGQPSRALYLSVEGLGHGAIEDLYWDEGSISEDLQLNAQIGFTGAFLRSEVFGEEEGWREMLCAAPVTLDEARSNSREPITVAVATTSTQVELTLAGMETATAFVYAGSGAGSTDVGTGQPVDLADAVPIGQLPLSTGVACASLPLPPELAGYARVQVQFEGAGATTNGRVIDLFGVDAPEPETDDSDPPADSATDGGEEAALCGCHATSTASSLGFTLLLPLALRRRRK